MSTMTSPLQRRGRVLRCVISTAERGAALNDKAGRETTEALRNAGPEVGAVLLAGDGPNFCTGGDVRAFAAAADPGVLVTARAREFHAFQRAIAGEITAEAERVAAQLADGPTAALGRIKRLIRDGASAEFGAHLDAEAEQIAASASGAEGREGVRAFTGRRPPRFHDEPAVPAAPASRE
jgi:enoyl-CoA hydratase/carnithine racemase